jgi:hypothetical protein
MIDWLSLLLSHGLLLIAIWRLLHRPDLDDDHAAPDADMPPPITASSTVPRTSGVTDHA